MNAFRRFTTLLALGAGVTLSAGIAAGQTPAGTPTATAPAAASTAQAVAFVGDKPISAADVEARVKARIFRARQEAYDAQVEGVKALAFDLVQEQEAAKLGLTREAFYKREVTEKTPEPSNDEVQQIFTTYRARLPKDDEAAKAEVRRALRDRNAAQRVEAFKTQLLGGAKLRFVIEPPRLAVPLETSNPTIGPAAAAVTLVEFSDFQCPYCQRAQATIKQLRDEYGDRVRFAFKQLPLGMPPQARLGAESALCAADQGKYWEARTWLFAHQGGVTVEALKAWAKEAGIDEAAYAKCVDGHARAKDVDSDMAVATSLATSSTPAFFVNGRLIEGALPVQQFREVIDDELARAAARPASPVQPPG